MHIVRTIQEIKSVLNPALEFLGVLAVNVDLRKKLSKEVIDFIKQNYEFSFLETSIRVNVKIAEAPSHGQSVIAYAPKSNGAKEYLLLAEEIIDFKDHVYGQLNYNLNVAYDGRKIVGDNPEDINDRKYGNNNVVGPEPKEAKHGTHVAGIVAQVRGTNLGGDGVTNNAEILTVRAVPNGDEYDKDIALGIRYAVDNGAKVINGSFGKYYSQQTRKTQSRCILKKML
jgi:subtilisin family serine protease